MLQTLLPKVHHYVHTRTCTMITKVISPHKTGRKIELDIMNVYELAMHTDWKCQSSYVYHQTYCSVGSLD